MKKILISSVIISSLLLSGCSNSTFDKAMEEGKLAFASNEYSQAEGLFKLALEEKSSDTEANALYNQTSKYVKSLELKDTNNIDDAIVLCSEIEAIKSESTIILDKAKDLKNTLNDLKKSNIEDVKNLISQAEGLMKNGDFNDAKSSLNTLLKDIKDNPIFKNEVAKANTLIEDCDKNISTSNDKNVKTQAQESSTRKMPSDLKDELILYIDELLSGLDFELAGESYNVVHNGLKFFRSTFTYACDDGFIAENDEKVISRSLDTIGSILSMGDGKTTSDINDAINLSKDIKSRISAY